MNSFPLCHVVTNAVGAMRWEAKLGSAVGGQGGRGTQEDAARAQQAKNGEGGGDHSVGMASEKSILCH